ncbi:MAG: D-aminoacylase [Chloroflexi bacterium]|nr:D-aminoacylase [Chloroflexota bacterium]
MFDALIKGSTIVDGTGNVGFKGDVAIEKDRLKILVGDTSSVEAASTIDASGCIVAPGFIDVHTHSGLVALSEPLNDPKIRQGVTTEIIGLDGLGYAPLSKTNLEMMLVRNSGLDGYPDLDYDWSSIAEYLERFRHTTSGNFAFLIPNSCLRVETVGWEMRTATEGEIGKMKDMIRRGMAEGAVGMSTGLQYPPGSYASTEELIELCRTVAECGGVHVTHVRYDLGDGAFDGFREAVAIGVRSGCPIHFSHYFATIALRGQTARMLEFVDDARARGVNLSFDAYPWEAGSTMLDIACPQEAYSGGPYELLKRLRDRNEREKMRGQSPGILGRVDGMVISAVRTEKNKWCEGLTVGTLADKLGKDPWDTMCDLMVEENLGVAFYNFGGDMNDVKVIITHPAHMFCSDSLRIGGMPNPRTYATYPKILGQLVRDERILPMEQAIRKMTSFPAQRFGLADRGILRDGMKADIVVFDPLTVSGVATFPNPKQFPLGVEYVLVNGKIVLERGKHTGATPGEALAMRGYVRS